MYYAWLKPLPAVQPISINLSVFQMFPIFPLNSDFKTYLIHFINLKVNGAGLKDMIILEGFAISNRSPSFSPCTDPPTPSPPPGIYPSIQGAPHRPDRHHSPRLHRNQRRQLHGPHPTAGSHGLQIPHKHTR